MMKNTKVFLILIICLSVSISSFLIIKITHNQIEKTEYNSDIINNLQKENPKNNISNSSALTYLSNNIQSEKSKIKYSSGGGSSATSSVTENIQLVSEKNPSVTQDSQDALLTEDLETESLNQYPLYDFNVLLDWTTNTDFDLYVKDPEDFVYYYGSGLEEWNDAHPNCEETPLPPEFLNLENQDMEGTYYLWYNQYSMPYSGGCESGDIGNFTLNFTAYYPLFITFGGVKYAISEGDNILIPIHTEPTTVGEGADIEPLNIEQVYNFTVERRIIGNLPDINEINVYPNYFELYNVTGSTLPYEDKVDVSYEEIFENEDNVTCRVNVGDVEDSELETTFYIKIVPEESNSLNRVLSYNQTKNCVSNEICQSDIPIKTNELYPGDVVSCFVRVKDSDGQMEVSNTKSMSMPNFDLLIWDVKGFNVVDGDDEPIFIAGKPFVIRVFAAIQSNLIDYVEKPVDIQGSIMGYDSSYNKVYEENISVETNEIPDTIYGTRIGDVSYDYTERLKSIALNNFTLKNLVFVSHFVFPNGVSVLTYLKNIKKGMNSVNIVSRVNVQRYPMYSFSGNVDYNSELKENDKSNNYFVKDKKLKGYYQKRDFQIGLYEIGGIYSKWGYSEEINLRTFRIQINDFIAYSPFVPEKISVSFGERLTPQIDKSKIDDGDLGYIDGLRVDILKEIDAERVRKKKDYAVVALPSAMMLISEGFMEGMTYASSPFHSFLRTALLNSNTLSGTINEMPSGTLLHEMAHSFMDAEEGYGADWTGYPINDTGWCIDSKIPWAEDSCINFYTKPGSLSVDVYAPLNGSRINIWTENLTDFNYQQIIDVPETYSWLLTASQIYDFSVGPRVYEIMSSGIYSSAGHKFYKEFFESVKDEFFEEIR